MFTTKQLEALAQMAAPVLTVYVATNLSEEFLHNATPRAVPWLKDESRIIGARLSPEAQAQFLKQVEHVENFLAERVPHERSLVIFAGPGVWETVPLQFVVQNELHWGKPDLAQLFWLAHEHHPLAVVTIDHTGARFLHYQLGELIEDEQRKFVVDISQWRRGDLGHVSGQNVQKTYGLQRDAFEKRIEAQYAHICREIAHKAAHFCTESDYTAVLLVGASRLVNLVRKSFPGGFLRPILLLNRDLAGMPIPELRSHLEPKIADWERRHEAQFLSGLAEERSKTVTGFDETLASLQKGKVRTVALDRRLNPTVHQCVTCGWVDRSADSVCSVCGGKRRTVTLREVLPELAQQHEVAVEVVGDASSELLKEAEGMAGWLRKTNRGR